MDTLFPDARGEGDADAAPSDTSGIFLDIHSHGRLILWPWGHVADAAPNGVALQTLGRKLAFFNDHHPHQAIGLYPTSGTTEDYAYGVLGRASFTYELGTTFFQSCSDFEDSILDGNLASLLYAFKVARQPYVIPAGPDVREVSLSDAASTTSVTAGTAVTLSATFDDTRYGDRGGTEASQDIAAGEYYVDTPPWAEGAAAVPLSASDGAFDSQAEDGTASIDTTGWRAGRHTVFVRAKDADNNWGAVSAAFLFVDVALPATPAAPTLTSSSGQIIVAWTAPADNGSPVTGYRLRHKPTGQHFGWSVVDSGTSLAFTITEPRSEEVAVQMLALNAVGSSGWSVSGTATALNRSPEAVGSLPPLSLRLEDGARTVEVSGAFRDPDRDTLTYGASSSDQSVATVSVSGSEVEVTPLSGGTATVSVTATDVGGSNTPALQQFGVSVTGGLVPPPRPRGGGGGGGGGRRPNRPPEAVGTLADRSLTFGASPVAVDVASAFRDPDRDELTYAATSSAEDVAAVAVEGRVVTVAPVGDGTAVVTVTAADGEASHAPAAQAFTVTVVVDYDADADGLIEVRTLAQFDALRHDLDGDGVPAAAGVAAHAAAFDGAVGGLSCAGAGCRGYELLGDLDFDTNGSGGLDAGDAYWNDGAGWSPVGTEAEPYAAAFDGNGRVIRHLLVAGGEGAGLFGATGPSSVVARVGLIAADVTGTTAVGALAGRNGGRVTGCWATGRVAGTEAVGGLVGVNDGRLAAVYATGRVSGTARVGGLVGHNRGALTASYATGRVRGGSEAGGLVGAAEPPGTVTAGYWDTETSGLQSSAAGGGLATSALQRPTAYGGLYAAWNVDADGDGAADGPWHLGTAAQYPVLSLDVDGDGRASWQELGRQLQAGPTLTALPAGVPAEVVLTWTAADTSAWTPAPEVVYTVTREAGTTVETVAPAVRGARYVDVDVQPGCAYTYQVAAVVDGGEAARSARVTAEVPCAFTVTPLRRDVLWTAGAEQVAVTTAPGCAWTAASESGFLAVTSGAPGPPR